MEHNWSVKHAKQFAEKLKILETMARYKGG